MMLEINPGRWRWSSAAPSEQDRFFTHFPGFRFAPPQAIILPRLRRLSLRATLSPFGRESRLSL
jgi:hypothetical protein